MLHFNDLSYYTLPQLPSGHRVPKWLSIELGIFAGRLYVGFEECAVLKQYLQLSDEDDGPDENAQSVGKGLANNAIGFLLEWLALRRKTQDITHTPMGYICQDRPLHENHPFFWTGSAAVGNDTAQDRRSRVDNWDGPEDAELESGDDLGGMDDS